jgi:hypothetical protein
MQSPPPRPTRFLLPLLAAALVACGGPLFDVPGGGQEQTFTSESLLPAAAFARPLRAPAAPVAVDGLLYSADVQSTTMGPQNGPMSLVVRVHVRNPGPGAARLNVDGCTVIPEFRHAGSQQAEPDWTPAIGCAQAPYGVDIAAGATHTFEFLAYDAMLAAALEDGRYDVVARFRLPGRVLRLDAGTADVRLMVPNLAFHVSVDEDGGWPGARVRVENRNDVSVGLEWGHCAVGFEVHERADRSDAPVALERERVCLMYLATGSIPAGGSLEAREFSYRASAQTGRNPALRAGTYHLVVTLRLNWRTYRFPMGTLVVN